MRKKIAGIVLVVVALTVATGLAFADTAAQKRGVAAAESGEVNFTAQIQFDSTADKHVKLELTNYGNEELLIYPQAHYIDEIGSAGSWDCQAAGGTKISSGESGAVDFEIADTVTHGDNSILAFFFKYEGKWYLGKVGKNNGVEYYLQHD